jgi:hypothetical protein
MEAVSALELIGGVDEHPVRTDKVKAVGRISKL